MAQQDNSRGLGSLGEENVAPDSQTQQRARPRRASSRRRRRRHATRESQPEDASRTFQVYKYSSRAPPMGGNHGSSSGPAQIPALPDDGNVMGMMARSASYWGRQEPPRCWIRGCACARSETPGEGHCSRSRLLPRGLLDEEGSPTSRRREQLFSVAEDDDDDDDGGFGGTWGASYWDDLGSDDDTRRFVAEYTLVPLSRRKRYSAQTFHDAVERFLSGF